MKRIGLRVLLSAISIVFLINGVAVRAQNTAGTLVGHVKDPSGAAVVGAKLTATNVGTGEIRTATTNQVGDYTVSLLNPGTYDLTVSSVGFKGETKFGIVLNVDQTVRTDMSLVIGSASASVTVAANALSLDTDTASVGQVVSSKDINQLPLYGRNFQDLMFLSPGAVNNPGGEQSTYRITISGTGISSVSIGGSRGSSEGYTVDGTTILDIGYDTPAYGPSLDDIQEFDELSKSYSAAYGYSMNQINLVSKSGTNSYHGSVFEYLRNNYVDAIAHGTTISSTSTIPTLRLNQFGYSLGGPVLIPRVYNGKNKTFFFANYEGYRQTTGGGSAAPASVPTSDEMNGKFYPSVLGNFTAAQAPAGVGYTQCGHTYHAGDPHPLFNPFDPNGCPFPVAPDGSYTIPANLISNLGKIIMRPGIYYPSGSNVSGATVPFQNYLYSTNSYLNFDQQNYRIDQTIGSKDQIFFHAVKHDEKTSGTADVPTNSTYQSQPARLYTTTETHVFSPNLTNQIRLGFMEALWVNGPNATITQTDLGSLNWPNPFTAAGEGYPHVEYDSSPLNDGYSYGGGGAKTNYTRFSDDSIWDLGESAIWSVKRHTLSFGFGGRRIHLNLNPGDDSLGTVNYNGEYSGDSFADSLLGTAPGLTIHETGPLSNPSQGPEAHLHLTWWAPWVQDDWRVNDKLTLNLGLRYEYLATPFEEQNFFIWPDFNAPGGAIYMANSKIVQKFGGVNPFAPATGIYVSPPNGERGPGPSQKNDWSPRLGFAYQVNDKTVLRGGFGKYFDTIEENELQASSAGIYPSVATVASGTDAGLSYPAAYNTNSLPKTSVSAPILSYYAYPKTSTLGFLQIQGDQYKNPYYLAWNLGVERELPWQNKLIVEYVANHGADQFSRSNPNAPKQCIALNGCTVTANTSATVPWQQRTPYRNLGYLDYAGFDGFSNYNAMNVEVEHRTQDLDLIASYTWSKELDTKSGVAGFTGDNAGWAGIQDGRNISAEYGLGNFDVGQALRITMVYGLPFGRGKAFASNISKGLDEVIGGWQFGTLTFFQGGLPFTVSATDINGANNTYAERANINPTPAGFHKSLKQWYSYDQTPGSNDATYTQPAPGYYGDSHRDSIRMPGQINSDMSLTKNFPVRESLGIQFRLDAFNALNHWNPGQPENYGLTGVAVGQIFPYDSQTGPRIMQISGRVTF